jgi:hypothetical protein
MFKPQHPLKEKFTANCFEALEQDDMIELVWKLFLRISSQGSCL